MKKKEGIGYCGGKATCIFHGGHGWTRCLACCKFVKTQKQLANYIQKKYDKGGTNIAIMVRNLVLPNVTMPVESNPQWQLQLRWKYGRVSTTKQTISQQHSKTMQGRLIHWYMISAHPHYKPNSWDKTRQLKTWSDWWDLSANLLQVWHIIGACNVTDSSKATSIHLILRFLTNQQWICRGTRGLHRHGRSIWRQVW